MSKRPSHKELEQSVKDIKPGDHLCCIYETEKEHRPLLTAFMRQGLERGEKIFYIVDGHTGEEVLDYLRDDGVVVEPYLESGQLVTRVVNETYMRGGRFDPDAMISLLRDETERALSEGFSALRVTGEPTWALKGLQGSERFIEYEAKLNEFFPVSKCLGLCQYDRRRFDPGFILDILATHPIAVVGTKVFDNFYYMPPKDFLGPDPEAAKLDKRLNTLLETKQTEAAMYESEEKYRKLFEESRDTIILADPKTGTIVDCNYEATRLIGRDKSELIGQHQKILHPSGQGDGKFSETFQKHRKKSEGQVLETQVITSTGEIKDVEIKATLIHIGNKKLMQGIFQDITERKRAEESLKLFRALIERSNDAIEVLDPETGRFLDVNDKACADLGYSREECLSLNVFDIDPSIDPSLYTEAFMGELREKGSSTEERFHLRKDGTTFPVELNLSFVQLDRGYIVTVSRDITERKRAEEAIRESEKKYRTILESIEEGYYEVDIKGNFTFFNDSMCRISGYTRDELMGMNNRDFLTPETAKNIYITFNKVYQTGKPTTIVGHELIRKDGSKISIAASASLIKDSEDNPVGFRGIIRDVTEEKRIQAELIQTKSFLQNIFDSSANGIATTDLHGSIIYMSPRVKDILGYDQEELVGKKIYSVYSNGKEDAKEIMKALTDKGELRSHEITLIRKDGSPVDTNVSASLLKNEKAETIGTLGIFSDITEQKRLEAQLQQAQKMEAIGTLAGGVAHDFNNILTTIIGNAQLMLMTVDENESLRTEIEEIKTAGERAAALTSQLLAFSRKQIVQPKILDLNRLLAGIEKMLARLIGENIEILMVSQPVLWQVEIDPNQMEQAIINLAVNAKDAMPNGGKLTIETANIHLSKEYFAECGIIETQPGPYVMVAVSDTGIGMDEEIRKHIFEPFYSTKEKGKGTGLGLSTVYGIVKQNRGFVWVYSEPGHGSTFKIYLPRMKEDVKPEKNEQPPVDNLVGTETVLIIEDDAPLRDFAKKALRQYGYRVLAAKSGEAALRISKEYEGPIDLVVTDVVMPTMNGKETIERLQPYHPQMKVIYMSGYTDNAIVHLGVLEPGLNFLEKPFSSEGLARKVREVLDK
jgi:two-component system cell cycle sensor histidine kinase/response regulator CckA